MAEPSVLLFGDTGGLPRLLHVLERETVIGLVRAEIRPEQERELAGLASEHGLPLIVQPRFDTPAYPEFSERVRALAPSLIVVDSYSMLLRPDVLAVPSLGAVNVHYAPLPRYRGPNPTQWSIIEGERETGVTLHEMAEEADAGAIVAQRRAPIRFVDTWVDVNSRLDELAEELLAEALPRILAGEAEAVPQDEALATTSRRRTPEDGLIDWSQPVRRIYDLIRALVAPLPGATYRDSGEEVVLDRFLTIGEVAALRFGDAGGAELAEPPLRAVPVADPDRRTEVELGVESDGERIGTATVAVDPEGDRAEVSLEVPDEHRPAAESLARRFATEELLVRP